MGALPDKTEQRPRVTTEGAAADKKMPGEAITGRVPQTHVNGSATRRRDRIKLLLSSMIEQRDKVLDLVREAQESEDHIALGFASWTAYAAAEFGDLLAELGRDDRRLAVVALAQTGMSTRAVAGIVGTNQSTVTRDLQVMRDASPDPATDEDLDDDREQDLERVPDALIDATEQEFEDALTAARANGDVSQESVVRHLPERRVTGLDGKCYPSSPEPRKSRRRPLPDQYRSAVWELTKAVERLERLQADDRFAGHRAELGDRRGWMVGDLAGRVTILAQQLSGEVK